VVGVPEITQVKGLIVNPAGSVALQLLMVDPPWLIVGVIVREEKAFPVEAA